MVTTITREDWDTLQRIAGRIGGRFVLNDGITIADPEPPEEMVRLAAAICRDAVSYPDAPNRHVVAALAALQHAEKVVRYAPSYQPYQQPTGDWVSRRDILAALTGETK